MPAPQFTQADDAAAPTTTAAVPAGQPRQDAAPAAVWKKPAAQKEHEFVPLEAEYEPAAQAKQVLAAEAPTMDE